MADLLENPYRSDRVADDLFVGRQELIGQLAAAILEGRNAIRAVMGGRGMGKSSLVKRLAKHLGQDALAVVASGEVSKVTSTVGRALAADLSATDIVGTLVTATERHPARRVAVILDEIEKVLSDPEGRAFLENLREAYEEANGRLAVLVLGGTEVRELLLDKASPFLRIAGGIHTLKGLARHEAAELLRNPLGLDVPEDVVDALWAETAGHPWLLQMFMELAVRRSASLDEVVGRLPEAMREAEGKLHDIAFPVWWSNLQGRGQDVYRRLAGRASPVPRAEWVARFGNDPKPWLSVLASTGVASLEGEAILARGTLFQRWAAENHPAAPPATAPDADRLDEWLAQAGVNPFERLVVRSLAAWARATVEFPAAALKHDATSKGGNADLLPEASFQIQALSALLQHERDLVAEPEALSMRRQGRSDIKVRSLHDRGQRACIEFKIFGRKDDGVVRQVIGYAAPGDTFAAVVSVDRCDRPLRPAFEERCFNGAPYEESHDAPAGVLQPAFYTEHAREGQSPLRVWHILVQLRDA
jgi:type II secretory pathway predicted ATPase ExeA